MSSPVARPRVSGIDDVPADCHGRLPRGCVGALAFRASSRRGLRLFAIGVIAPTGVVAGKFRLDSATMTYMGDPLAALDRFLTRRISSGSNASDKRMATSSHACDGYSFMRFPLQGPKRWCSSMWANERSWRSSEKRSRRLHGAVRLRWGFLDEMLPAPWLCASRWRQATGRRPHRTGSPNCSRNIRVRAISAVCPRVCPCNRVLELSGTIVGTAKVAESDSIR